VDVNLLEKQMNLVSELVLLRNRLLQIAAEANEPKAARSLAEMSTHLRALVGRFKLDKDSRSGAGPRS
jgi:chemotaxis protein histidine kinase CheA